MNSHIYFVYNDSLIKGLDNKLQTYRGPTAPFEHSCFRLDPIKVSR